MGELSTQLYLLFILINTRVTRVVFNIKSVDDTTVVGLITEDGAKYRGCVDELVDGCLIS